MTIRIYDTDGYLVHPDDQSEIGRPNETIRDFFKSGLRLAVDYTDRVPVVIGFIRAKEFEGGRTNQYFVECSIESDRATLHEFKAAVTDFFDQNEMVLDTSMRDMELFNRLDEQHPPPPGSEFEHEQIRYLLGNRRRLAYGIADVGSSLSLLEALADERDGIRIAVCTDERADNLAGYDVVLVNGQYTGLEPLGATATAMEEAREHLEEKLISTKLDSIRDDVLMLREQTSLSDDELRRRLTRTIPLRFRDRTPRSDTRVHGVHKRHSGGPSRLPALDGMSRRTIGALGVLVIVLVAVVGGTTGGLGGLLSGGNASNSGNSVPNLVIERPANGTELDEGTVTIVGNSSLKENAEATIWLKGVDGIRNSTERVPIDSDGRFDATFANLRNGTYTIIVEAGSGNTSERRERTVTVNDTTKPSLVLTEPSVPPGETDRISGTPLRLKGTTNGSWVRISVNPPQEPPPKQDCKQNWLVRRVVRSRSRNSPG